jgi:REP element-mobilizing transposase RayT
MWYHVVNRGNRREPVFHKPGDYDVFVEAMTDAGTRVRIDLLGYCLMPNHFHLIVRTDRDGDLGRWMQWLLTAHARRYHRQYGTTGHVWQGRFKAFPVEEDDHLVTVLRYVERNALRAELVSRAEDWKWSSLPRWQRRDPLLWSGEGACQRPVLRRAPTRRGPPTSVDVRYSCRYTVGMTIIRNDSGNLVRDRGPRRVAEDKLIDGIAR